MTLALFSTLCILLGATLLFLSERIRPDLTSLIVVVSLAASGVLNQQEAFAGFSRPAVITIMAIFILAEGLERTGVTEQVGSLLLRVAGHSEALLVAWVMVGGAFLSLFMNNIAAASVLLPAVAVAARSARISASRLLMPLAFSTILGGMATLLTTSNIVVSGIVRDQGFRGFGLLDFAPVGGPMAVAGIIYMILVGRHRLPKNMREGAGGDDEARDLLGIYSLGEHLFCVRVPAESSLVDSPLDESSLREVYGVSVVAVERGDRRLVSPQPDFRVHADDVLVLSGELATFSKRDVEPRLEILPPRTWTTTDLESYSVIVVEVMLSPRSTLIGHTLAESLFRGRYGMNVLAVWRSGQQLRKGLGSTVLRFGDALLLQGPRSQLPVLRSEPDLIVLADKTAVQPRAPGGARSAVAIMLVTLLAAALAPQMVAEVMMAGALMMLLRRLLTLDDAYRVIDWKTVFLVAGMLPMGTAMVKSGAAALAARMALGFLGTTHPIALLALLFLLTSAFTQCMSGAAVAAIMTPVAIKAALACGADPRGLAMAVALGTSMAFPTPLGHHVNILVMGQGGYTFRDFFRVGGPLALLLFIILMLLLPLVWRVTPH